LLAGKSGEQGSPQIYLLGAVGAGSAENVGELVDTFGRACRTLRME